MSFDSPFGPLHIPDFSAGLALGLVFAFLLFVSRKPQPPSKPIPKGHVVSTQTDTPEPEADKGSQELGLVVTALQAELKGTQNELDEAYHLCENLKLHIRTLERRLTRATSDLELWRSKAELAATQVERVHLDTAVVAEMERYLPLPLEDVHHSHHCRTVEEQRQALHDRMAEIKQLALENKAMEEDNVRLHDQARTLKERIKALEKEVVETREAEDSSQEMQELKERCETLQSDYGRLQGELTALKESLGTSEVENKTLEVVYKKKLQAEREQRKLEVEVVRLKELLEQHDISYTPVSPRDSLGLAETSPSPRDLSSASPRSDSSQDTEQGQGRKLSTPRTESLQTESPPIRSRLRPPTSVSNLSPRALETSTPPPSRLPVPRLSLPSSSPRNITPKSTEAPASRLKAPTRVVRGNNGEGDVPVLGKNVRKVVRPGMRKSMDLGGELSKLHFPPAVYSLPAPVDEE